MECEELGSAWLWSSLAPQLLSSLERPSFQIPGSSAFPSRLTTLFLTEPARNHTESRFIFTPALSFITIETLRDSFWLNTSWNTQHLRVGFGPPSAHLSSRNGPLLLPATVLHWQGYLYSKREAVSLEQVPKRSCDGIIMQPLWCHSFSYGNKLFRRCGIFNQWGRRGNKFKYLLQISSAHRLNGKNLLH